MAKAKTKSPSKSKINFKELLLQKGEYIALGIGGLGCVILLLWGVTAGMDAKAPDETVTAFQNEAQRIRSRIAAPVLPPAEEEKLEQELRLKDWNKSTAAGYPQVPSEQFIDPRTALFDPVGRPDTKWEIPQVLTIREAQVDLVRAPMMGFDIIYEGDGRARIAVLDTKMVNKIDDQKLKETAKALSKRGTEGSKRYAQNRQNQAPPMPPGPGGPGATPGLGGEGGFGFGGGGYDQSGTRTETTISYIPIEDIDKAMAAGKPPAATVIPLRMIVVHCSFPLKEQEEALRRALRMSPGSDLSAFIHFDGFEVRRRVVLPNGQALRTKNTDKDGWEDYNYEDRYAEIIHARKFGDHFDVDPNDKTGESQYIPYFLRYHEAMAVPLPALIPELGQYPKIRLPKIQENIKALVAQGAEKQTPTSLAQRLQKQQGKRDIFMPRSGEDTGAAAAGYGGETGGPGISSRPSAGPTFGPPPVIGGGPGGMAPGTRPDPRNPGGAGPNDPNALPLVTLDHLLIRFVDCDVRPGYTYQYELRVRMENPVWGEQFQNMMANRTAAVDPKNKVLYGPWTRLGESLTVPYESFVYAVDPNEYNQKLSDTYPEKEAKPLVEMFKSKETEAVIQVLTWMEQVRTEAGGVREPVGAWVVANMPVGRGEYIGRKAVVQLPLWSSALTDYTLREVPGKIVPASRLEKNPTQPKGWLIDFTGDKSVLVDFEGGKVRTRNPKGATIDEETATELLIVQSDGTLTVRNSATDMKDPLRVTLSDGWTKWLTEVKKRVASGGSTEPGNGFGRPGDTPPKR